MKIGVIGVGQMGSGMARSLIKAGHEVTVWNRSREKADEIARAGARVAALPAEACGGDAVITMLADDAATEAVVFGADGILTALRPGNIHIAMSTISVALSKRPAAAHGEARQSYAAARVFGRPEAAAAAKLFVLAAGAAQITARRRPAFDAARPRTCPASA